MKKFFYTAAVAAIALGMTACGGKKEEATNAESAEMAVNNDSADENIPASVNVTVEDGTFEGGDMAEYVAIVPGEYTFNYSDGRATIELKAKALQQADKQISNNSKFAIYDADGKELGTMSIYGGFSDLSKAIKEGNTESEYTLKMNYYGSPTEFPEFMTIAKVVKPLEAKENVNSSSSSSSGSSSSGSSLVSSSELSTFISNGKSGNIDKMLEAFEWLNKTEAGLKSQVRALNEDAIKAAIEIDKANEEIGGKYDTYSLMGALNNMTDKMSRLTIEQI